MARDADEPRSDRRTVLAAALGTAGVATVGASGVLAYGLSSPERMERVDEAYEDAEETIDTIGDGENGTEAESEGPPEYVLEKKDYERNAAVLAPRVNGSLWGATWEQAYAGTVPKLDPPAYPYRYHLHTAPPGESWSTVGAALSYEGDYDGGGLRGTSDSLHVTTWVETTERGGFPSLFRPSGIGAIEGGERLWARNRLDDVLSNALERMAWETIAMYMESYEGAIDTGTGGYRQLQGGLTAEIRDGETVYALALEPAVVNGVQGNWAAMNSPKALGDRLARVGENGKSDFLVYPWDEGTGGGGTGRDTR